MSYRIGAMIAALVCYIGMIADQKFNNKREDIDWTRPIIPSLIAGLGYLYGFEHGYIEGTIDNFYNNFYLKS